MLISKDKHVKLLMPSKNCWSCRADSRFAPSQWETALLCNDISHWLGASLESALVLDCRIMWWSVVKKMLTLLHWCNPRRDILANGSRALQGCCINGKTFPRLPWYLGLHTSETKKEWQQRLTASLKFTWLKTRETQWNYTSIKFWWAMKQSRQDSITLIFSR